MSYTEGFFSSGNKFFPRWAPRCRQLTIAAVEAGAQESRERSTGLLVNFEMVKKARELKMQYMDELKVLQENDRDTSIAETGDRRSRLTGTTSTRATRSRPNYRSRVVCQETRRRSTIDVEYWRSNVCRISSVQTVGHFTSTHPIAICTICLCVHHQWQVHMLPKATSNVWIARGGDIVRQKDA